MILAKIFTILRVRSGNPYWQKYCIHSCLAMLLGIVNMTRRSTGHHDVSSAVETPLTIWALGDTTSGDGCSGDHGR